MYHHPFKTAIINTFSFAPVFPVFIISKKHIFVNSFFKKIHQNKKIVIVHKNQIGFLCTMTKESIK